MKKTIIIFLCFFIILMTGCSKKNEESIEPVYNETITTVVNSEQEIEITEPQKEPETAQSLLEVHFIDVGQGDSTLIICDGEAMLIDGGNNNKGTAIQLYLKKQGVSELKYLVATHPDADHIGGLDVIVTKLDIEKEAVWMPDAVNETPTYYELLDAMNYRGYKRECPSAGSVYKLGASDVTIVGPSQAYESVNDNSIIVKVSLGDSSFLFMGDAGSTAENNISDEFLSGVDVIKVGHHGSKSSTSEEFIARIHPEFAVISCGSDNDYGHPSQECLEVLKNNGVLVFRTDEQGSVIARSDGIGISWNQEPSDTWRSGVVKVSEEPGEEPEPENLEPAVPEEQNREETESELQTDPFESDLTYVVNTNSNIFHKPDCESVGKMKEKNRVDVTFTAEDLKEMGIKPCGACKPDQE